MLTTKEKKEKNKIQNAGNCQMYLSCMMHYSRGNDGKEKSISGWFIYTGMNIKV